MINAVTDSVFRRDVFGGISAHWRRDGKELFFVDSANNMMAVDVDTSGSAVRLGVPHALFSAAGTRRGSGPYDVTAPLKPEFSHLRREFRLRQR
jgi:hypothetical protein